jgi:hypothetical protein
MARYCYAEHDPLRYADIFFIFYFFLCGSFEQSLVICEDNADLYGQVLLRMTRYATRIFFYFFYFFLYY